MVRVSPAGLHVEFAKGSKQQKAHRDWNRSCPPHTLGGDERWTNATIPLLAWVNFDTMAQALAIKGVTKWFEPGAIVAFRADACHAGAVGSGGQAPLSPEIPLFETTPFSSLSLASFSLSSS